MEHYLQTYTEPLNKGLTMTASTSSSSIPSTTASTTFVSAPIINTSSAADQILLPLSRGCLTNNLGIPITIVCCKVICMQTYISKNILTLFFL